MPDENVLAVNVHLEQRREVGLVGYDERPVVSAPRNWQPMRVQVVPVRFVRLAVVEVEPQRLSLAGIRDLERVVRKRVTLEY